MEMISWFGAGAGTMIVMDAVEEPVLVIVLKLSAAPAPVPTKDTGLELFPPDTSAGASPVPSVNSNDS